MMLSMLVRQASLHRPEEKSENCAWQMRGDQAQNFCSPWVFFFFFLSFFFLFAFGCEKNDHSFQKKRERPTFLRLKSSFKPNTCS
jgi:hypothetical protein